MLVVRRLFAKRHVYEHNGGVIHERYAKKVPEDAARLGERAELAVEEFERAAELVRRALDRIARSVYFAEGRWRLILERIFQ